MSLQPVKIWGQLDAPWQEDNDQNLVGGVKTAIDIIKSIRCMQKANRIEPEKQYWTNLGDQNIGKQVAPPKWRALQVLGQLQTSHV